MVSASSRATTCTTTAWPVGQARCLGIYHVLRLAGPTAVARQRGPNRNLRAADGDWCSSARHVGPGNPCPAGSTPKAVAIRAVDVPDSVQGSSGSGGTSTSVTGKITAAYVMTSNAALAKVKGVTSFWSCASTSATV